MVPLDSVFESFLAASLSFEDNYDQGPNAPAYKQALRQCRFGIKQGGLGFTSAALVAPAALYVALRDFREWYGPLARVWAHRALHLAPWLAPFTNPYVESEDFFPYFRSTFDSTLAILHEKWQIHGSEQDTRPQHQIVHLMKASAFTCFTASLSPSDQKRVTACAQQSFPTRSTRSDIRPALHQQHDTDHLRHSPLGLFSLTCPYELSNAAFLTSTSILLGVPVPHTRVLRTQAQYGHIDQWADLLLNDAAHASTSRYASHNAIVSVLAEQATNHGISTTAELRRVPLARQDTSQRGDMVTLASGVLCKRDHLDPNRSFGHSARLVMDFTLGHTYSSYHVLKEHTLETLQDEKVAFYKQKYNDLGWAFAPLVANSFGQFGPELLRFLWALSDHAARSRVPVPQPIIPVLGAPAALAAAQADKTLIERFKRLRSSYFVHARLAVLTAVYEGVSERVYGRTHALRTNPRYWDALRARSTLWQPGPDLLQPLPPPPPSYADILCLPPAPPSVPLVPPFAPPPPPQP